MSPILSLPGYWYCFICKQPCQYDKRIGSRASRSPIPPSSQKASQKKHAKSSTTSKPLPLKVMAQYAPPDKSQIVWGSIICLANKEDQARKSTRLIFRNYTTTRIPSHA